MNDQPIYVDEEIFLGRIEEQERFREALRTLMVPLRPDDPPWVFLLYGEGGMGKSKLACRFRDIARLEAPFESAFHVLLVDWEIERYRDQRLQIPRHLIRVETVLDILHARARDSWGSHFREYQKAVKQREATDKKVAEELAREGDESRYRVIRD